MTHPISYLEINSPDLRRTRTFVEQVFDWHLEPFAQADYLVAAGRDAGGIDTGLLASRDGQPRTIPIVRVDDLQACLAAVVRHEGPVVVPPALSAESAAVATSPTRPGCSSESTTTTRQPPERPLTSYHCRASTLPNEL